MGSKGYQRSLGNKERTYKTSRPCTGCLAPLASVVSGRRLGRHPREADAPLGDGIDVGVARHGHTQVGRRHAPAPPVGLEEGDVGRSGRGEVLVGRR